MTQAREKTRPQQDTSISIPLRSQVTRWEKVRTFPIEKQGDPDHPGGYAHRIGSVDDLALYRLKIHVAPGKKGTRTLPGLFLPKENVFRLSLENGAKEEGREEGSTNDPRSRWRREGGKCMSYTNHDSTISCTDALNR